MSYYATAMTTGRTTIMTLPAGLLESLTQYTELCVGCQR